MASIWTLGALASLWPDMPPVVSLDHPDPGFKYAAGLYHSQEALSDEFNTNHDKEMLARALLKAGRLEEAISLESDGLLPSRDLALQFRLADDSTWMDLEKESWKAAFRDDDGESRYWRARLAESQGAFSRARQLLERILREDPASIFVPLSQEKLAVLPFEDEGPIVKPPTRTGGFRVQWGVFRDPARARQQRSVLEAYGQRVDILSFERDGIPLSRVVSEPFATREEARSEGESLKARYGLDFVVFTEEPNHE
jgi:tetratricopeptide (TPR) repeat protein